VVKKRSTLKVRQVQLQPIPFHIISGNDTLARLAGGSGNGNISISSSDNFHTAAKPINGKCLVFPYCDDL
jgi:hypothetical protein